MVWSLVSCVVVSVCGTVLFQFPLLHRKFVDSFINFPKPIVAAVNGPAVGISVTLLGLYDFVYAADRVCLCQHCVCGGGVFVCV